MSNKQRWPLIGAGVPLGLFLLLVAAWGIDSLVSSDHVVRGVYAGDTDLGGLSEADVVNAAADLTTRLSTEPVTVTIGATSLTSDPVALGASIDGRRLAADALAARRDGFILVRPFKWLGTFFSEETIEINYRYDTTKADEITTSLINPALDKPSDPLLMLQGDMLTVIPGADGAEVDPGLLATAIPAMISGGAPYTVTVVSTPMRPDLETSTLQAVADEANAATANPILLKVLDGQAEIEGTDIRSWISLTFESGEPDWVIDVDQANAYLQPLFPLLGSDGQQATFDVIEGKPVIIPSSDSVVCCDATTAEVLKAGLLAPLPTAGDATTEEEAGDQTEDEPAAPALRTIELIPAVSDGAEGVAELESLGITEVISTFTTKHKCCENRVTNIQLMAEIVQGFIIRPGESFDLNEVVGKRDSARGFKPAGAIASGNFEDQIGGGVSQFTTTIFNAAFFGGLDIDEYQSHSIYFSRYPRGREATISWPKPDFIITNPTEYGILVWPTWNDTSITVTFYSTKNIEVFCVKSDGSLVSGAKACDESLYRSSQNQCTRYTTKRQRVFANGDVQNDSVFAVYRPGQGLDCAGNSTDPDATTTTTTDPNATTTTTTDPNATTTTTVDGETTTTTAATTSVVETTPTTLAETTTTP